MPTWCTNMSGSRSVLTNNAVGISLSRGQAESQCAQVASSRQELPAAVREPQYQLERSMPCYAMRTHKATSTPVHRQVQRGVQCGHSPDQ